MTAYESDYQQRMMNYALILLLAHLPLSIGAALYYGGGMGLSVGVSLLLIAGPAILNWLRPGSLLGAMAVAVSLMGFSALLIRVSGGQIEMHFHIFVVLAFLVAFARVTVLLAGAGTIALHHVGFWFFLPRSVFSYDAGFGTVLLHASFVVAETGVLIVIARMFRKLLAMQGNIRDVVAVTARDVASRTAHLGQAGASFAESASAQASSLEETAASLEEIRSMTKRNAEGAESALGLADETKRATELGAGHMKAMVEAMDEIQASSGNISNIIKTIDEIAFQTNILALNAAVEAARAGEAGAGFSVVADEVRILAQRAAQAARETSEKIDDSVRKSMKGVEISGKVAEELDHIASQTRQVNDVVVQIAAASREQAAGLDQIATTLGQMDKITQANAATADETARSVAELSEEAARLLSCVDALADDSEAKRLDAVETRSLSPVTPVKPRAPSRGMHLERAAR